jgi:hypothetical protein
VAGFVTNWESFWFNVGKGINKLSKITQILDPPTTGNPSVASLCVVLPKHSVILTPGSLAPIALLAQSEQRNELMMDKDMNK